MSFGVFWISFHFRFTAGPRSEFFGPAADLLQWREGPRGTSPASPADVILVVWAATKHAVYRVFDDVREKLAYVLGTGPRRNRPTRVRTVNANDATWPAAPAFFVEWSVNSLDTRPETSILSDIRLL